MTMNRQIALLVAAGAVLGCTAVTSADKVHIAGSGLDFHLKSTDLPGLFSNAPGHQFTGSELRSIHESINAAGINTDGVVTFIIANTSAGLSMFALVDNNMTDGPKNIDAMLGMTTTTNSSAGWVNNDNNFFANGGTHENGGSTQTQSGDFFWHPDGGATGMAWTGLQSGNSGSFNFTAFMGGEGGPSTFAGLTNSDTFQFVSWTGTTWNLKRTGSFDGGGSFSFAFAVVPVPPALGLGLAGLGMVVVARRRRKQRAKA
jgi:MYXO-CTERM domain-containing protein